MQEAQTQRNRFPRNSVWLTRFIPLAVGLAAIVVPSSASAATWTFTNTTPLTNLADQSPCTVGMESRSCRNAAPYPSSIDVSTNGGSITGVDVTLNGLSHSIVWELAIALSGPSAMPGARSLMLMNCAGNGGADNLTLTFDDSASAQLPDNFPDPITSGAWKPTMHCAGFGFPSPGPGQGTYANPGPASSGTATLASTFGNKGPNGTWSLYVTDFNTPFPAYDDVSIAGGWSLTITTSAPSEPVLTATDPPSPADGNSPRIIGSAPAGTTIRLYDGCPFQTASQEVAMGTAEELASPGIPVTVPDNSTRTFFATAEQAGVGGSNCSNAITYTEQTPPPDNDGGPGGGGSGGGGQALDGSSPLVTFVLGRQRLLTALRRGYGATFTTNEAATAVLELLGNGKLIARTVRVARGTKRAPRSGRFKVVARFTRKARRKLARKRSVTLVARLTVTDAAGNRARKSKRIRLRR